MSLGRKGFVLVEAVLAVGLISASQLMRIQIESKEQDTAKAISFGKEISDIGYAIDRRVTLDGYQMPAGGSWDSAYPTTNDVVSNMLGKELIARDNPDCGVPSGWVPVSNNNKTLGLVSCDLAKTKEFPFGFSVKAARKGAADDPSIFSEWTVHYYHRNPALFNKHFKHYQRIVNAAKVRDPVNISGSKSFKMVDMRTGIQVSNSQCLAIGTDCAIEMKLSALHGMNQIYLRQDGTNSMFGAIKFKTSVNSGDNIKCFRAKHDGGVSSDQSVDCGVSIGLADNSIKFDGHEANVNTLRLTNQNYGGGATPVPVKCKNKLGNDSFCGFAVIDSASPLAVTYANDVIATGLVRAKDLEAKTIVGDDLTVKRLTSSELIETKDVVATESVKSGGNIEAQGDVVSEGKVTVKGDVVSGGTLWSQYVNISQNMNVGNAVHAKSGQFESIQSTSITSDVYDGQKMTLSADLSARNINASGSVNAQGDVLGAMFRPKSSASSGGICSGKAITTDSSGNVLSCVSGKWSSSKGANAYAAFTDQKIGTYRFKNNSGRSMIFTFNNGGKGGRNGCYLSVSVDGVSLGSSVNNNNRLWKTCHMGGVPVPSGSTVYVESKPWIWDSRAVGTIYVNAFYL